MVQSLDISPASIHDVNYLKDIQEQINHCTLLGNRGYLSAEQQLNLFETSNIELEVSVRKNQTGYQNQENELKHYFLNCVISL